MAHKVGDILFFSVDGVAGEGMVLGTSKAGKNVLVLVVGKQFVEIDAGDCTATKRGLPAEGASWRRAYLKLHPGALQP